MTAKQIADTLRKIRADRKQLDGELSHAIEQHDRPWLEALATAYSEVIQATTKAIADCGAEIAAQPA